MMLANLTKFRKPMQRELHQQKFGRGILMFVELVDQGRQTRDSGEGFLEIGLGHVMKQVEAVPVSKPLCDLAIWTFLFLFPEFVRVRKVVQELRANGFSD